MNLLISTKLLLLVIIIAVVAAASFISAAGQAYPVLFSFNTNVDGEGPLAGGPVIDPNSSIGIVATAEVVMSFNATGFSPQNTLKSLWQWQVANNNNNNNGTGVAPTIVGNSGVVAITLTSVEYPGSSYCTASISTGANICCFYLPNASSGGGTSSPPYHLSIPERVTTYENNVIVPIAGPEGVNAGEIRLQDPFTCKDVWSVKTAGDYNPSGQVTAAEETGEIFFCDSDSGLQRVRPFGTKLPNRIDNVCSSAAGGAPGVKNGFVYVAAPNTVTTANKFYKIEPRTGAIIFQYQTPSGDHDELKSKSQIAFWKDDIVYASMAGGLYSFNCNGTSGVNDGPLRWGYSISIGSEFAQFIGAPVVIGDDPAQNARTDNRFEKYYGQLLISPSIDAYVQAFDVFSGDPLWRTSYGTGGAPTHSNFALHSSHNGTTFILDDYGEVYAVAACAIYAKEDCPLACRETIGGCGCEFAFDEDTCNTAFLQRRCQWCGGINSPTGFCGYRAGILNPDSPSCDCSAFDQETCASIQTVCQWCPSQKLCSNTNRPEISYYNYECDCRTYNRSRCSAAGSANCRFCEGSTNSCTAASLPCECLWIPSERLCDQANSSDCAWCPNTKTCSPIPYPHSSPTSLNPTCSCNHFNNSFCTSQVGGACRWCEFGSSSSTGVCASECKCSALDEPACDAVDKATNGAACKFCSKTLQICINPQEMGCNCGGMQESQCKAVQENGGACAFCSTKKICVSLINNATGNRISNESACQCVNLEKSQCDAANGGVCKFCSNFDACVPSNQSCTCEHFSLEHCETAIKSGICKACKDQGRCVNALQNPNCSCSFYDKAACTSIPISQCLFCENSKSCESNVNAASRKYPACSCYARNDDFTKCEQTADCKVFEGVVGVGGGGSTSSSSSSSSRGKPFCAPASIATQCAPTSCTSIGSNQDLCEISGCHFDDSSSALFCEGNSKCFSFFLDNFVPQSWFLLFFGLIKDVFVLILLGSTDIIQRTSAKMIQRVSRMYRKIMGGTGVDYEIVPDRMDETVYICDASVRDGDLFKDSGDFSTHVWKVCDQLFYWSEQPTQRMKQKLFDAVAFSLVSNQSWVAVADEEIEEIENNRESLANNNNNYKSDDETTNLLDANNNNNNNNNTATENNQALAIQLAIRKKKELNKKRRKLRPNTLRRNEPQFFRIVDNVVTARTSYYIFYSHSRELSKRISSSINLFPDQNTLFFYVAGIIILFASTLSSVVGTDHQTIQSMTNGCGAVANFTDGHFGPQPENPWWWTTTASPSSASSQSPGNQQPQQYNTAGDESSSSSVISTASFFLTGYRLMNASSFATACLVFVKFIRGLAQKKTGGGLEVLTVEEKIPILTVTYSFGVQVLLGIYAILILPFALTGFLYGWPAKGLPCGVPLMIGAGLIFVDYILVRVFTKKDDDPFESSDVADEDANDVGNQEDFTNISDGAVDDDQTENALSASGLKDDSNKTPKIEQFTVSPREAVVTSNNSNKNNDDQSSASSSDNEEENNRRDKEDAEEQEEKPLGEGFYSDAREAQRMIEVERESSRSLVKAILYFLLTQEFPTLVLTLMFQMSFNYCALLEFPREFALIGNEGEVYDRDAAGRSLTCTFSLIEGDISAIMSSMSSFLPFM